MQDGTYNKKTMEMVEFTTGYQFTFCQEGMSIDDDVIQERFNEIKSLTDGVIYVGVYNGVSEISFHTESKALAEQYAILNNQISIWDWANMNEISTYGTGKVA